MQNVPIANDFPGTACIDGGDVEGDFPTLSAIDVLVDLPLCDKIKGSIVVETALAPISTFTAVPATGLVRPSLHSKYRPFLGERFQIYGHIFVESIFE